MEQQDARIAAAVDQQQSRLRSFVRRRHWRRGCGEDRYQNFAADTFTAEQREQFRHRFAERGGGVGKWAAGRAKS